MRSVHSRRGLAIHRSQIAFARGAWTGVDCGRWPVQVRGVRRPDVGDGGDLVGVAVEVRQPRGYGRCRMEILTDAVLHPFVTGHVEPGATVITDAWMGYHGLAGLGYAHDRRSQRAARARGEDPGELLPGSTAWPPGQAVAAGHPPGLGRRRAPAELP